MGVEEWNNYLTACKQCEMWSVHFFPFLFLFPFFFFHWESFLLRWLHWDKQQRNLIKWMPGVTTLSKHAAALSINQRMLKKKKKFLTLLHMSIGELWMQAWMDRGCAHKGDGGGGRIQGQWEPIMLFQVLFRDFHVLIAQLWSWGDPIRMQLGMQLFVRGCCCLNSERGKYL